MIGSILGDIAGSQYEFSRMRPKDLDWEHCDIFTDKCRFTDDTVTTIATAAAIKENKEKPDFAKWYRQLCLNHRNVGYGGMFRDWLDNPAKGPYGSFGNGSAMRVSPVADLYDNIEDVINHAKESALVTHNHPQGIKGAVVIAVCTFMAKEGKSKEDIYKYTTKFYGDYEAYKYPVTKSLKDIRDIYKWDVTCQGSVPVAIRCWYEADSYEEFIRNVMSLPCDMDTLAAIGGTLAEYSYGINFDKEKLLKDYLSQDLLDLI